MILYLAGPMRGIRDFNFDTFLEVGESLRRDGHLVLNPAERDIDLHGREAFRSEHGDLSDIQADFELSTSLGWDLDVICHEAEGVAVLDGWVMSSGAVAEVAAALALGKPVFVVEPVDYHGAIIYDLVPIQPAVYVHYARYLEQSR